MRIFVIALFIALPTAEIITFIKVGGLLGLWLTIGIIILTAIIGLAMLKSQGKETLYRAILSLQKNRFPVVELFDAFCLLIAGIFLLTPGFITDVAGFLFLTPFFRTKSRQILIRFTRFGRHVGIDTPTNPTSSNAPNAHHPTIIEGEYDDLTTTKQNDS
jgi:UPF0716 protein FxsA